MDRVFVGVVQMLIRVPGARTRKDRRQTIQSLEDRIRHRFEVSVHELGDGPDPTLQTIVLTTAGNDAKLVRSALDQCVGMVHRHPVAEAGQVDVDVFRWQPSEGDWAARMMAELVDDEGGDGSDG